MDNAHGYKGFGKGLICRGKQYAEDTDFEEKGGEICGEGMMHYCVRPLDVLRYYGPMNKSGEWSEFTWVEALDKPITDDGIKYATKKLHIGARLSFGEIVKASVEYDLQKAEKGNSQNGNYSGSVQNGNYSGSVQNGYYSGSVQNGDYSGSIQTGKLSASLSTGDNCSHEANGEQCIAVGWGRGNKARGKKGSYLVLAEYYSKKDEIKNAAMAVIDGESIKEDTWYMLKNGKFTEVE